VAYAVSMVVLTATVIALKATSVEAIPCDPAPRGTASESTASLVQVLKLVPDPRARRGIRHALPGIVAVTLAVVVAGARSFAAIGQWASELTGAQLVELGRRG